VSNHVKHREILHRNPKGKNHARERLYSNLKELQTEISSTVITGALGFL